MRILVLSNKIFVTAAKLNFHHSSVGDTRRGQTGPNYGGYDLHWKHFDVNKIVHLKPRFQNVDSS